MQVLVVDALFLFRLVAILLSVVLSLSLLYLWFRGERRMNTDLPFIFGITFLLQSVNALMSLYIPEMPLDIFRIRSLLIMGTSEILLYTTLFIWDTRFKHRHPHILLVVGAYWSAVALLAPTAAIIMTLTIPILLTGFIGLLGTFIATWKTGRLKEIRSDLLVVSILCLIATQVLKVPLASTGLSYLPDAIVAFGIFIVILAFIIPRRSQSNKTPNTTADLPLAN